MLYESQWVNISQRWPDNRAEKLNRHFLEQVVQQVKLICDISSLLSKTEDRMQGLLRTKKLTVD